MMTRFVCPRCGGALRDSEVDGYRFTCDECDEDFYKFEAREVTMGYNSENTKVLATHMQGDNKRMLLLHTMQDGRHEYIIGSYFTEKHYDGGLGYEHWDYSWDWGHYFNGEDAFLNAAHYWEREVLWREAELFEIHDEAGFLEGNILQVMRTNDGWSAHMYEPDGTPTTYRVSGFDSKEELLDAFKRHRRGCELESDGKFER